LISWTQFIKNVFLDIYIVKIVLLACFARLSSISNIACLSYSFVKHVEYSNYIISYIFVSWLSSIIYIAFFISIVKIARFVTLFLSLNIYVSKALLHLFAKSTLVFFRIPKKNLLKSIDFVVVAMRSCKRYLSNNKIYILNKISKKYIFCVKSSKLYNLAISFSKFRRIYKKKLRIRNAIRKTKTKSYYLQN